MINYARELAHDKNGIDLQEFAVPYKALARYSTNNAITSSVITLNDNTTSIEVSAVGQSVAVRWIPATETSGVSPFASVITLNGATANFDIVVPANYYRRLIPPIEGQGVSSIVGLGVQAGTYRRVAVMSAAAVSSIMVTEY